MSDTTIQGALNGASDWLDSNGWIQTKFVSDCGDGCLLFAVAQSLRKLNGQWMLRRACLEVLDLALSANYADYGHCLEAALRKYGEEASGDLIIEEAMMRWNDRPGRTAAQVIRAIQLAAGLAESAQRHNLDPGDTDIVHNAAEDAELALAA